MVKADRLASPMVLSLKAKEGFGGGNPYQVGRTGLMGNSAAALAMDGADTLLLLGTDFPPGVVPGGQGGSLSGRRGVRTANT